MPAEAAAFRARWALLAVPALALLWAGLLFGVSFLATPVKFTAPSLSLPVALDVGQATFHLLVMVEWGALVLLVAAAFFARLPAWHFLVIAALAACLLVQTFALLPPLDARVASIIAGQAVPRSALHLAYMACEVINLALLLTSATAAVVFWRRIGLLA
ncbi:MAG: hypothetical protein IT534_00660 [Bauldia sp.]|nr:hypothetical protein [Bauldia sp.]